MSVCYSITNTSRRITHFIQEESRRWLYSKIQSGAYQTNKSTEAKFLFNEISTAKKVTENTYDRFVRMFMNNPVTYFSASKRPRKLKAITSDNVLNYFVNLNNVPLPIGFIVEFFEDDYETQAEVNVIVNNMMDAAKTEFISSRSTVVNRVQAEIESAKSKDPTFFKFHPVNLIRYALRLTITVIVLVFLLRYLSDIHFAKAQECKNGTYSISFTNEEVEDINKYVFSKDDALSLGYTIWYSTWEDAIKPSLSINIFIAAIWLLSLIRTVKMTKCYIRGLYIKSKILRAQLGVRALEKKVGQMTGEKTQYEEYCEQLRLQILNDSYRISAEDSEVTIPNNHAELNSFSVDGIIKEAQAIKNRDFFYLNKSSYSYKKAKKKRRSANLIFALLVILAFVVNCHPVHNKCVNSVIPFIVELVEKM